MDENNEKEIKSCDCSNDKWVKFALIVAAVFLGCYLATYYILDQMRHSYYAPICPIENIDNVIKEQDKLFDDFEAMPVDLKTMLPTNMPVVQTFKKGDDYKVIIDLKPFNNDVRNIKLKIEPYRISVFGEKITSKKNSKSDYAFSQSFSLPERIDLDDVTKEVRKDKYIITLPIDD